MKKYIIRPGTPIECALVKDDLDKNIEVRKALLFDATDDHVIVSQTRPPLTPSSAGKKMSLTYINKKISKRLGMSGEVEKIINDYRTSPNRIVPAILLKNITGIKSLNLRYSYRVRPPAGYDIELFMDNNKKLQLIDFSASGIKFSCTKHHKFKIDQKIAISLSIRGKVYDLSTRVIRKEKGRSTGIKQVEFISAQFIGFNKKLEDTLAKEVRKVERHIRFNRVV